MINPYYISSMYGVLPLFESILDYLVVCQENNIPLPIEYFEALFLCFPDDICAQFDWDFQSFFDYLMNKGDFYES